MHHLEHLRQRLGVSRTLLLLMLGMHAIMLAYAGAQHSPTTFEPKSLVAGLSHWELARFDAYKVNPPLVRMVAALPVIAVGYKMDWASYSVATTENSGQSAASQFMAANGERAFLLITVARWACIPFSVTGAVFCFLWARELAHCETAGLIAAFLWCCEPNILAHGELITSDCAAASFGVGAGYCFWRWQRTPSWSNATMAGVVLGLAELTKLSWVTLFALWPILWAIDIAVRNQFRKEISPAFVCSMAIQLAAILAMALLMINLSYAGSGTLTRLGDYTFISATLNGGGRTREEGNRFRGTWIGAVRLPVPRPYIEGIDLQKADFEDLAAESYLRGEWQRRGWWYYYLYGLCVKTSHGVQVLLALSVALQLLRAVPVQTKSGCQVRKAVPSGRDFLVVLAPALLLLTVVSSQLQFNIYFKYVLPALGFFIVFIAATISAAFRAKVLPS